MIKIYYRNLREKELSIVPEFKVGSWVYAENPTEEEIHRLAKKLNLEEGLLTDALDTNEVPRMELEGNVTYIYTRVPTQEGDEIKTVPLLIAVGKDFVLTLSKKEHDFLTKIRKGNTEVYTTQKTKFFIQIFKTINERYSSLLNKIGKSVRESMMNIKKISKNDIAQFVRYESVLNDFISSLLPTKSTLEKLLSGSYLKLYEEDEDLIEDLFLANGQLIETSKSTLKTITNIRGAYSTMITHDLNRVIKLLTALTIILTIPTIVTSAYGMNISLPFQDNPLAFFGVLAFTILVSVILLVVFIKNEWI